MADKISVGMVEAGVDALAHARKLSDEAIVGLVFNAMLRAQRLDLARLSAGPAPPYVHQSWPSWRYGPDGDAILCASADDVPEGYTDTPAAFEEPPPVKRGRGRPPKVEQAA